MKHLISTVRIDDSETSHHWNPQSQTYTTAPCLLKYLRRGWLLEPPIAVKSFSCYGGRHVNIYYFTLTKDGGQMTLPILANPIVLRLIRRAPLTVVSIGTPFDNDSIALEPVPAIRRPVAVR